MRRATKFAAAVVVVVAAAAATLPFWLGAALHPAARLLGGSFERYERISYGRFALEGATFRRKQVTIRAGRIEADTPVLWLWRHLRHKDAAFFANRWSITVASPAPPRPPLKTAGMADLHARLDRLIPRLASWIHLAHLRDGAVSWPRGGFTLRAADWTEGRLSARGMAWAGGLLDVQVERGPDRGIRVAASQESADLRLVAVWRGQEAKGTVFLWSQPLECSAHFDSTGWVPREAEADAANWNVEAARTGLEDYASLQGGGRFNWRDGRFELAAAVDAKPKRGSGAAPLRIHAQADGDRHGMTVTALRANLPAGRVDLSGPVSFGYRRQPFPPAHLAFSGDLPQLSRFAFAVIQDLQFWRPAAGEAREPGSARTALDWIPESGTVRGTLDLEPGPATAPRVAFSVDADAVAWAERSRRMGRVEASRLSARGSFLSSRLAIDSLEATLGKDGGIRGSGAFDFKGRRVEALSARGRLGAAWVVRFLPEGVSASAVRFDVAASGPWADLRHSGTLVSESAKVEKLAPVAAELSWKGRGFEVESARLTASSGPTRIEAAGSGNRHGLRLAAFRLFQANKEIWHLLEPGEVAWFPRWRADVRLGGRGSSVVLRLSDPSIPDPREAVASGAGKAGRPSGRALFVELKGVRSEWVRNFVPAVGADWTLDSANFTGRSDGGNLDFSLTAGATVTVPPQSARVSLRAEGGKAGIRMSVSSTDGAGSVLGRAEGTLPVGWNLDATPHAWVNPDAHFQIQATAGPRSALWPELARRTGAALSGVSATLRLGGSLRSPIGTLEAKASRIVPPPGKYPERLPPIEDFSLFAHADQGAMTLDSLNAVLGGQAVSASGRLPMTEAAWEALYRRHQAPDLSRGELRVDADRALVAPFAVLWPDLLVPRGTWSAHIAFARGQWSGAAQVSGVVTRPIGSIGIVQDINADLALTGHTFALRSASATLGGQTVRLEGTVQAWLSGPFSVDLRLKGENIPFVRKPGILVRANVDLHAFTGRTGTTSVSGTIGLADTLFLADLTNLLPGTRGANRAPPYFSVPIAPFRDWTLAVSVGGERAIRIETAVFTGTASASVQLAGTLGEPRAVGEVRINDGQVAFPFIGFDVQYGSVQLSLADPYHPQLVVSGESRRYGYDLKLDVRGPVDSPAISFTSIPSLPSDQLLSLVMAGQLPPQTPGAPVSSYQSRIAQVGTYFGEGLFQKFGVSGADRLTVTPGPQLSVQGNQTYTVEYRLSRRWSLLGEYDEFDHYDLDAKWRVYLKGAPP